jgi:hypothetical protein
MVIDGTRCHASSRLRCDWRADCHARVGCRRPVSARQIVISRLWGSDDDCRTDRYRHREPDRAYRLASLGRRRRQPEC